MSGTRAGGVRTAKVNKQKYGSDYYARIGALGGKASTTGGFFANREMARKWGAVGGRRSKRPKPHA